MNIKNDNYTRNQFTPGLLEGTVPWNCKGLSSPSRSSPILQCLWFGSVMVVKTPQDVTRRLAVFKLSWQCLDEN